MSIDQAEQLKTELTEKYVKVADGVPELRRFANLTGVVKTINMNCRALVEFDGPADIGWYDIDPAYLTVVDAPVKTKKAAPAKEAPAKATSKAPAKPAADGKKLSPLELARQQGAVKKDGAKPATPAKTSEAKPAAGGKKLSPLELARQQGAVKKEGTKTAEAPAPQVTAKPSEGKKLSPLELARQQGAFQEDKQETPATEAAETEVAKPAKAEASASTAAVELPSDPASRTQAILDLCRQQGAFEG